MVKVQQWEKEALQGWLARQPSTRPKPVSVVVGVHADSWKIQWHLRDDFSRFQPQSGFISNGGCGRSYGR